MTDSAVPLTEPGSPPTPARLAAHMGKDAHANWARLTRWIDRTYPGTFTPDWLYGGQKHGWALRYKKSRSFCTLAPLKGQLKIQIVFGEEERTKVEAIRGRLSSGTRTAYDRATTFHDGKWLFIAVDSERVLRDVELLLSVKRKPKGAPKSAPPAARGTVGGGARRNASPGGRGQTRGNRAGRGEAKEGRS